MTTESPSQDEDELDRAALLDAGSQLVIDPNYSVLNGVTWEAASQRAGLEVGRARKLFGSIDKFRAELAAYIAGRQGHWNHLTFRRIWREEITNKQDTPILEGLEATIRSSWETATADPSRRTQALMVLWAIAANESGLLSKLLLTNEEWDAEIKAQLTETRTRRPDEFPLPANGYISLEQFAALAVVIVDGGISRLQLAENSASLEPLEGETVAKALVAVVAAMLDPSIVDTTFSPEAN